MSEVEVTSKAGANTVARRDVPSPSPIDRNATDTRIRIVPLLTTLASLALALFVGWGAWQAYMATPWTRDGTVRAYVVTIAPEIAGRIVDLPVKDNQFVHKGQLLMVIEPTDFVIAVNLAKAAVEQTRAVAQNAEAESLRRQEMTDLSTSVEVKQTYASQAVAAEAAYQQAVANLNQAQVNLERTRIVSPVNGYVTNLIAQVGDFATIGQAKLSLVDADSFWVDGYFEETSLCAIQVGDPANIKLMGYRPIIRGHVGSIASGITVPNAQQGQVGLATVNPIFTWVRLAQRVPVRIDIDHVPDGIKLAQGETATVEVHHRRAPHDARHQRGGLCALY
jgi:multidrug resistance efflux pump